MKIVVFLSRDGWRWRLQAKNGAKLATSEAYSSARSCWRTVYVVSKALGVKVRVE